MKQNILNTLATKFFSGIVNLLLIIFTTQFLGAEGKGEIGIFVLNLTVILMASDIIGGAGLIYVVPRSDIFKIAVSSYAWAIFVSVFSVLLFYMFHFTESKFLMDLFLLSILLNISTVNSNILVAKEKINLSNFLSLIQIIIQVSAFSFLIFYQEKKEIGLYIFSLYLSYGICVLLGIYLIKLQMISFSFSGLFTAFKKMFQYGIFVQLGNFIQLLNYRLSYYLLEHFHGAGAVGIYSTGTSLAEAVWLISNSVARVQYARISNSSDISYSQNLSIRLSKITLLTTIAALLPLIFLPEKFYILILGNGFADVKTVVITLFIGVCSFGLTSMYSHYFSGTGKVYINTIASFFGLIFTLIFGFILIPQISFMGAGITASISYFASSVFLTFYFLKDTKISAVHLIPSFFDIRFFIAETKKIIIFNRK